MTWHFMWISCKADDPNEMSSHIISKTQKKKYLKELSAVVVMSVLMFKVHM